MIRISIITIKRNIFSILNSNLGGLHRDQAGIKLIKQVLNHQERVEMSRWGLISYHSQGTRRVPQQTIPSSN